jgi:plasmid stabilization system protein ParE
VAEVAWQSRAVEDLEEIRRSMARDTPAYAADLVFWVMWAVHRIEGEPTSGRILPGFVAPNLREVFVRNHRIVYQVIGNEVVILTIRHGSRPLWDSSDPSGEQPVDESRCRADDGRAPDLVRSPSEEGRGPLVTRDQMLHAIRSLPDDATARDAAYALETVEAINIAIADVEAGGPTYTQEEIEREMAEWTTVDAAVPSD